MEACLPLFSAPDARKEAAWVADQVALLLGGTSHTLEDSRRRDATLATPCSPGEVAVLVRMKALIPPLKTALERRGVPCSAPETAPFWGDPSAALILELAGLRFQRPFAAPEGPGSLDVDVPQLAASLPEQLWQAGPSALASHLDAAKLLAPLFTESAACNALLRAFREQGKTWEGLLDWVCLRQDLDLVREQAEQVQIMTLHAAKGLEFRAVFLPALEEGILPFPGADWKPLVTESWRALERLYDEGAVRAIGVCNFLPQHLLHVLKTANTAPMIDQFEFHPGYPQYETLQFCQSRGIQAEAWSPLGRGRLLEDPLVLELAKKYGKSPAQICLRFCLQNNVLPLPKSSAPERMKANLDIFDFEIEQEHIYRLLTMPQTGWSGLHPEHFE